LRLPEDADTHPMTIFYPVDLVAIQARLRYDARVVDELLGTTRARILVCIAQRPGLSTSELAAAVTVSPASASEHTSVLRRNRLVVSTQIGRRVEHAITRLGAQLLT
jgi:DNA-binding transcriptional ArsR family regulator